MTFFSTAELLEIGGVPFTIPEPKPTRRDALAYYRRVVSHHGIDVPPVRGGHGHPPGGGRLHARHPNVRRTRAADRVRGRWSSPREGSESRTGWEFEGDRPHDRVRPLLQGTVSLLRPGRHRPWEVGIPPSRRRWTCTETASVWRMVHFADTLDRGVKPWVRPDIENRIAGGEIPMHWNSRVARLGQGTATVVHEESGAEIEGRQRLGAGDDGLAAGRRPAHRPGRSHGFPRRGFRRTTRRPWRRRCRTSTSRA